MNDLEDTELVKCAQNGDVNAIGELYNQHRRGIFKYAWSQVYDDQVAEDLTSEIFTRMITRLPGYQVGEVPFSAWLYRIARNLMVDHYRREKYRMTIPIDYVENTHKAADDPVALVESRLTAKKLEQAMDTLDENQREVLRLRFLAGLSLEEVAQAIDKTVAATKSIQHRALTALRVALNYN